MGEIVGFGLFSHVPTIMLPYEKRLELNDGNEISFVPGFARLRAEVFDRLRPTTVVVFDSHWFTTVEHVVSAHSRRCGTLTSSELPRVIAGVDYDYRGNPALARRIAERGETLGTPVHASDDPNLPLYYATVNIVRYLDRGERWVSVSVAQTGEVDDFLAVGRAVGAAVAEMDSERVVLVASGGMSHRFWPLSQLVDHEASDPVHVRTPEARAADLERLDWMREGSHRRVIDTMPEYRRFLPEAMFGHYLMAVSAVGGRDCAARGVMYSDYENATGTGQVHMWFDRPPGGWTAHR